MLEALAIGDLPSLDKKDHVANRDPGRDVVASEVIGDADRDTEIAGARHDVHLHRDRILEIDGSGSLDTV